LVPGERISAAGLMLVISPACARASFLP